jgi:hypothetical protein
MSTVYVGVDPGASGGIAVLWPNGPETHKMPATEADLLCLMHDIAIRVAEEGMTIMAAIEKVHGGGARRMTPNSAFTFGMGYGGLRMAVLAASIPFREVTAQRWQKDMGCMTGGDKNVSKAAAQRTFPAIKVTHAIADALLIAEYLRRQEVKK